MMRIVLLLAMLVAGVAAGSYRYDYEGFPHFQAYLGSPPQGPFNVSFSPTVYNFEFDLRANEEFFDISQSSTFKLLKRKWAEKVGSDSFRADGSVIDELEVELVTGAPFQLSAPLSAGFPGTTTFIEGFLEKLGGHPTVVIAVKNSEWETHSGTIVVGDRDPEICGKYWEVVPKVDRFHYQYTVNASEIRVGSYQSTIPVQVYFHEERFTLDPATFNAAKRQLNVQGTKIRCTERKRLLLFVGNNRLVVDPDVYMETNSRGCFFRAKESFDKFIALPLRALNGKCIRYDYERKEVGFVDIPEPSA